MHEHELQNRQYPVEEDIAYQRKIWQFERGGWYVLLGIVVLTLGGLFSHGALSSVTATSAQKDINVQYERFHRSGGVNTMVIQSKGSPGKSHTLFIARSMLEGFSIDSMQPQPMNSSGTRDGLRLTLQGDGRGESTLYLALRSDGVGLFKSRIAVDGGGEVSVNQFIYP